MNESHKYYDPTSVAAARGGYSQAVEVMPDSRYLFISGQIPVHLDGAVPETFTAQCHAVWDNVFAVLSGAGYEPKDLVKVTTFLSSSTYGELNGTIRRERLGNLRPALTVVIAGIYDQSWLLEIDAVAARSTGAFPR